MAGRAPATPGAPPAPRAGARAGGPRPGLARGRRQQQPPCGGGGGGGGGVVSAGAVPGEAPALLGAGADMGRRGEPYLQARPEEARAFGLAALNRALEGITHTTAVHI